MKARDLMRLAALLLPPVILGAAPPLYRAELIFPPESWHNHSSSVVELPNGDLLACWFHGSGERQADDVKVLGARLRKGARAWTTPFVMADTPNFPDTNPVLFVDAQQRLWLFQPVVLANEWHTTIVKTKISTDYQQADGPPRWTGGETLLVVPRNMAARVEQFAAPYLAQPGPLAQRAQKLVELGRDKYFSRVGWFTRTHPVTLPSGRILVPLYSDGYSMSLVAYSDDQGATWQASEPIVGAGNIQPSILRRKDGTLVAYMRDNGPPPQRILASESRDDGVTWTTATDTDLPNPGASVEGIVLRDGTWLLVYNDLTKGRSSLAVALSGDEGRTWQWKRHLEQDDGTRGVRRFHYPSVIQARNGTIHVTYSDHAAVPPDNTARKSIKHAQFDVEWVRQGDPAQPGGAGPQN